MEIELTTDTTVATQQHNDMTKEEAECIQTIYDMFNDDEKLKYALPHCRDDLLLMSIRSYHCNAQIVFRTLKHFFHFGTEVYPDLFSRVNLLHLKPILDSKLYQLVKPFSDDSPGIIVYNIKRWIPSEMNADDVVAAGIVYIQQLARLSTAAQKNGIIFVTDVDGFNFAHARNCSLSMSKKMMNCMLLASVIKIVSCIVINSHYLYEKMYSVLKYTIPEKIRKDMYILKKDSVLTPLHNQVPDRKLLPRRLGGEVSDEEGFYDGVEEAAMMDTALQDVIANVQRDARKKKIH